MKKLSFFLSLLSICILCSVSSCKKENFNDYTINHTAAKKISISDIEVVQKTTVSDTPYNGNINSAGLADTPYNGRANIVGLLDTPYNGNIKVGSLLDTPYNGIVAAQIIADTPYNKR